jgi:hypothetical protein
LEEKFPEIFSRNSCITNIRTAVLSSLKTFYGKEGLHFLLEKTNQISLCPFFFNFFFAVITSKK